jgi:hypothetical protein
VQNFFFLICGAECLRAEKHPVRFLQEIPRREPQPGKEKQKIAQKNEKK